MKALLSIPISFVLIANTQSIAWAQLGQSKLIKSGHFHLHKGSIGYRGSSLDLTGNTDYGNSALMPMPAETSNRPSGIIQLLPAQLQQPQQAQRPIAAPGQYQSLPARQAMSPPQVMPTVQVADPSALVPIVPRNREGAAEPEITPLAPPESAVTLTGRSVPVQQQQQRQQPSQQAQPTVQQLEAQVEQMQAQMQQMKAQQLQAQQMQQMQAQQMQLQQQQMQTQQMQQMQAQQMQQMQPINSMGMGNGMNNSMGNGMGDSGNMFSAGDMRSLGAAAAMGGLMIYPSLLQSLKGSVPQMNVVRGRLGP